MAYPPQQGMGYPPQQPMGYPPQQQGYPQQQQGYQQQQHQGYPPQQMQQPNTGTFPPEQQQQQQQQQQEMPSSKVLFRMSCRDLVQLDVLSKSDPIIVIYLKSLDTLNQWRKIGHTECIKDNLNPDFLQTLELNYFFEQKQELRFEVFDTDSNNMSGTVGSAEWASKHDKIGNVGTSVGEIVGALAGHMVKDIQHNGTQKSRGKLCVDAEEISASANGKVELNFSGEGLDKKDWFGKSDPYIKFLSQSQNGGFQAFHKTEIIMNSLNPTWKSIQVPVATFCNGDYDRKINIEVYDWDKNSDDDLIGRATTTLGELLDETASKEFMLINPKKLPGQKKAKKDYKHSGVLKLQSSRVIHQRSFVEYLKQGLHLEFFVGVDFTGSNGNPSLPSSLHYFNPSAPNQYESAIRTVGNIIQDYDTDKLFPAFGYGAKLPNGEISFCFPMNFNNSNPSCQHIEGVVDAYRHTVGMVQLWGPTNFSPLITRAKDAASKSHMETPGKAYFVLLIVTDGAITDYPATVAAIVDASSLPLSIIIIGVGAADFSQMNDLDCDNGSLKHPTTGRAAARDIVQFVPFRDFANNSQMLAKEVLAELPNQVLEFMKIFVP